MPLRTHGLRRAQSRSRATSPLAVRRFDTRKVHPIADWTNRDVHRYLGRHDLPYHPLWREGYVSMRLPPGVVVHRETYDDSRLEAEVAAYDERNHARFPLPPEKQRHTNRYGVLEKCTWSENVTRQLSLPERAGFASFLNSKGIVLD